MQKLPDGCSLYPFQIDDVEAWSALAPPRFLWNTNQQGLGKTIDALVCAREQGYGRILIVTMASVRPEWSSAFAKWWPERVAPAEIDRGFTRKAMSKPEILRMQAVLENPTHIVSTELLPKLVDLHKQDRDNNHGGYITLSDYDYIVIDELHEIRSWNSKAFQALWWLRQNMPQADWKPLSGTPLGSDPLRMWPWLKLSEPHKWGNLRKGEQVPFVFRKMYGKQEECEYAFSGYKYSGINEAMLPKYKASVAHLMRRKTVAEVGLQLPPMRFEIKRHPLTMSSEDAAADWAAQAIEQEPVAVFCHNHVPMDAIQAVMEDRKISYVRLYDEQSNAERRRLVEQAERERCVILSTTGLVSTGVNYLANIRSWMLAQPCENPIELLQLAGRFSRISSKDNLPRVGYLLYREGDEFSAQEVLRERLATDAAIVTQTADAAALEQIIEGRSNQSFLDRLMFLARTLAAYGGEDGSDDDLEAA